MNEAIIDTCGRICHT